MLIAEHDQAIVGYATSSQFRSKAAYDTSVETSIYIRPDAHGQGIGSQLYQALLDSLSNEDFHGAYAGIILPSEASISLLQKFDFQSVGQQQELGRKFSRYWDVEWFEKSL